MQHLPFKWWIFSWREKIHIVRSFDVSKQISFGTYYFYVYKTNNVVSSRKIHGQIGHQELGAPVVMTGFTPTNVNLLASLLYLLSFYLFTTWNICQKITMRVIEKVLFSCGGVFRTGAGVSKAVCVSRSCSALPVCFIYRPVRAIA